MSMQTQFKQISVLALKSIPFVLALSGILSLQDRRLKSIISPEVSEVERQAQSQLVQTEFQLDILESSPDFGFSNLVADWTFLGFLQYFGDYDQRQITGYGLSADFFEIIIDRDPYSYNPYLHLSSSVSLFAAQPERAVALQERGLKSLFPGFPKKAYFIWRNKGIDEILFLDDFRAATKSHLIAAEWAAQTPGKEAREDQYSLRTTAEFLATNPDRTQVQANAWLQVLMYAPDDRARGIAIDNLADLGLTVEFSEDGGISVLPIAPDESEDFDEDDS